jgi:hypothetical protein
LFKPKKLFSNIIIYRMSKAYEIYKEAVGGKTMTGENMKDLNELPDAVRKAWIAIDTHYTHKPEITESATYELYKSRNKDAKDFNDLPDTIKRTWASLDKNYDKIVKVKEVKPPKPKEAKQPKPKSEPKAKKQKPVVELWGNEKKKPVV